MKQYETLKILSLIAESSAKPTQYQCTPREMILRSASDWDTIHQDLRVLAAESLVAISPAASLQFSITEMGINKLMLLEGKPLKHRLA